MKASINRVRWLRLTAKQRDQITAQIEATRADIRAIQDILGHVNVETTLIYTHPSTRGVHVRASVEALALPA